MDMNSGVALTVGRLREKAKGENWDNCNNINNFKKTKKKWCDIRMDDFLSPSPNSALTPIMEQTLGSIQKMKRQR